MSQLKKNLLSLAVAALLVGASTASAQVAFQMSSLIRNVRLEGTTEAVGTVTLAATTSGDIVAGSTISLDYGTGIVDVPAPVNPVAISGGTPGLTNEVTGATVVAGGTGYAVSDALTVVGGTGTAATLNVDALTGEVSTVSVTTGGAYTAAPSLTANAVTGGTGAGATLDLTVAVTGVAVNAGGTGYAVSDVLTVAGGTGTSATLTVTALTGEVATVSVLTGGSYTVDPTSPVSVTGGERERLSI